MKFLKLVNVPLNIFGKQKNRYGKRLRGGPIPWINMGFSVAVIGAAAVQYVEGEDSIAYLPISDEVKVNAILPLIAEDMSDLEVAFPDKGYIYEIVEDDSVTWKTAQTAARAAQKAAAEVQA
jgi:hypothetical protein